LNANTMSAEPWVTAIDVARHLGVVKEKSDDELLDHYKLAQGQALTNLGALCLGRQHHRAQLTTAPVI
jgi:prophage antirepressor-like protein